jgi:hypothetical protein
VLAQPHREVLGRGCSQRRGEEVLVDPREMVRVAVLLSVMLRDGQSDGEFFPPLALRDALIPEILDSR